MRIQGIRKYHDLESYIEKNIMSNKYLLENIIELKILNIHMEVRINNCRVDLVGQVEDESIALIETSIRYNNLKDFHNHRKQILSILEFIGKNKFVQIIFISPQFLNDDIREIESYIATYNAKVYFIQLSKELIFKMQNTIDLNKVFESSKLEFNNYLSVTSKNINKNDMFAFPLDGEKRGNLVSNAILNGLRNEIEWHIPLHRYKDLTKNIIRIGSGIADVMFNIYCNKEDKVKIEVDFAKRFDVFDIFKNHMVDMAEHISYPLCISSKKATIYSEIPIDKNVMDTAIAVAKVYIIYVSELFKKIQI